MVQQKEDARVGGEARREKRAFLALEDSPYNHIRITFAFENVNPSR
jgi:hypothetical protein